MDAMDKNIVAPAYENDEVEIDLYQLFLALKEKLWLILLSAIIVGGAAGAFSKFVITPQYKSTAMVYILSKETTLTSLADLQIGSQLTKDYKIIVTSRPVLQTVVDNLGLDMSYAQLGTKLAINNPADTRILTITATDPDPVFAKKIADEVAKTASDYIGDIMEMVPPKLIEDGEISRQSASPNNKRNALLGGLVAVVVVCGIIVLSTVMNDTIRSEEDVARYLGLSVLASVPEFEATVVAENKEKQVKGSSRSKKQQKGGKN